MDHVASSAGSSSTTLSHRVSRSCRRRRTRTSRSWRAARPAGSIGNLTALLTMLKGLPLAYDRDLQEDKEPVFDARRHAACSLLPAVAGMIATMRIDTDRLARGRAGRIRAGDRRRRGSGTSRRAVPRGSRSGRAPRCVVRSHDCDLPDVADDELASISPASDARSPRRALRAGSACVARRAGGTAPERVASSWRRLARSSRSRGVGDGAETSDCVGPMSRLVLRPPGRSPSRPTCSGAVLIVQRTVVAVRLTEVEAYEGEPRPRRRTPSAVRPRATR